MVLWAGTFRGQGSWLANGVAGETATFSSVGYGGGGAGGTVMLSSAGTLECGLAEASGGRGGLTGSSGQGPGGGGGGGLVLLSANGTVACPASAIAGLAGYSSAGATPSSTTDPRHVGDVVVVAPGFTIGNLLPDGGLATSPEIVSQANTSAFCGTPYRYSSRLVPKLVGGEVLAYRLEARTGELPRGLSVDSETGEIIWVPRLEEVGAHELTLVASTSRGDARQEFTVVVECPQSSLGVGCGCGSAPPGMWTLAALAGFVAWLRRARRPRGVSL